MKARQLRELSDEEIEARIRDTRKELFNLRFQHATGQLDNPHRLALARREIARLMTVRKQREHAHATGGEG